MHSSHGKVGHCTDLGDLEGRTSGLSAKRSTGDVELEVAPLLSPAAGPSRNGGAAGPGINLGGSRADVEAMADLPTPEELLHRKAIELDDLERPRRRAEAAQRDLEAAREQYWGLLEVFVDRTRELGVSPRTLTPASPDAYTPRIVWIEGFPLANGSVVSTPPLRYCTAERRRVRRPEQVVFPLEELTLFVPRAELRPGQGGPAFELHTASDGTWPRIQRLEHASTILTALRRRLETSLLELMG
jgi:hypothetical protein